VADIRGVTISLFFQAGTEAEGMSVGMLLTIRCDVFGFHCDQQQSIASIVGPGCTDSEEI